MTLGQRRSAIVQRWLEAIAATYPAEGASLLGETDPFRNPVGHVLRENIAALVDAVVVGEDWERATCAVAAIAQVRAVQGFTAEEAAAFVRPLRTIVRDLWHTGPDDARLERLTRLAVDLHAACRDRIGEIAAREAKRRTWLLERRGTHLTS